MSTTCLIKNQLGGRFYLLTGPDCSESDATSWGSQAYHLDNTCVGKGGTADIVTINRAEQIKDGHDYYLQTEVRDINLNLLCVLKEKLRGTLLSSDIWFALESGDGQSKTGWINSKKPSPFQFSSGGKSYQIETSWIRRTLHFDDIQYTLRLLE